jgi:hypothetical protein
MFHIVDRHQSDVDPTGSGSTTLVPVPVVNVCTYSTYLGTERTYVRTMFSEFFVDTTTVFQTGNQ